MRAEISKRKAGVPAGLAALVLVLGGCARDSHEVEGFTLPAGDIERGKLAFVDLGCRQCHTVAGVELPEYHVPMRFQIELGGHVIKVKRYGELLTSVVNPSHDLAEQFVDTIKSDNKRPAESPMPDFNHTMTIAQLIDIIEFLHSRYSLLVPEYRGIVYGP
jgi:L-cysteine S-thiosulfotransferase